jgi:hypothetical protein
MKLIYTFSILLTLIFFQSCETYGPATRCQNIRYMERPFYDDLDTASNYVSAYLTKGAYYRSGDDNVTGELNIHRSWTNKWNFASLGAFGQFGSYKLKDSVALGYYSFGIRGDIGLRKRMGETEYSIVNLALAVSYESGAFSNFRSNFEQKKISTIPTSNFTRDIMVYWGLKHRFNNKKTFSGRFGLGYTFNNNVFAYTQLDLSYKFNKNMYGILNAVFPVSGSSPTSKVVPRFNLFSLGVTYGF